MLTSPPIFADACDSDSANHNPECERCCCADASHSVMTHLSVSQILVKNWKRNSRICFFLEIERQNAKDKFWLIFKVISIFIGKYASYVGWTELQLTRIVMNAHFPIDFNQNFSIWKKSKRKKAVFLTVIRRTWRRCQMTTRRIWPWTHNQMLLRMI